MIAANVIASKRTITVPEFSVRRMWTSEEFGDRPELSYAEENKKKSQAHRMRRFWIGYQTNLAIGDLDMGQVYVPCGRQGCDIELHAWFADSDHLLARHNFGRSGPGNLVLMHKDCNRTIKRGKLVSKAYRNFVADAAKDVYAVTQSSRPTDPWMRFWRGEELSTDGISNIRANKQ